MSAGRAAPGARAGRRAAAGRRSGWTPTRRSGPTRCASRSSGSTSTRRASASCTTQHGGDGAAVRAEVLEIIADPRQDAQPGHRLRRHADRHRRRGRPGLAARPQARRPGRHAGLAHPDPAARSPTAWPAGTAAPSRCRAAGHAILFARSIAAVLPDDLDPRAGAGRPRRVRRARAHRPGRAALRRGADASPVLGGAGKSGSLALAAARRAGRRPHASASSPPRPSETRLADAGLADDGRARRRPRPGRDGRGGHGALGGPADVTVVCVDVPGCEHGAILATARRRHGDLLLHGDLVPGRRARRRGPRRRRHDAHRQRLRARPRRRSRWTCSAPSPACARLFAARLAAALSRHDGSMELLLRGGRVYSPADPARHRPARRRTAGSPGSAPTPTRPAADRDRRPRRRPGHPGVRRRARARHRHRHHAARACDLAGARVRAEAARPRSPRTPPALPRRRGRARPRLGRVAAGPSRTPPDAGRAGPGRRRPAGLPVPGRRALRARVHRAARRRRRRTRPATTRDGWLRRDAHHVVRARRAGLAHAGPAPRRPARRAARTPRRWASPPCTSAAGPAPPARTTSPACSRCAGDRTAARGVRLLGRAAAPPRRPASSARSAPAATCTPTARSARAPPTCASPTPTSPDALRARLPHRRPGRRRTSSTAPSTACRAASTPSATPRSAPCSPGSRWPPRRVGLDRLRAGRHRIEHVEMRRQGAHRRAGRVRRRGQHAAGVRPAVGRRPTGCTPSASASSGRWRPTRSRRWPASGVALAFGSDSPVTPLDPWGIGAGRAAPPQPGPADERAAGVRRAHPRRLAGRAPRRRGRARARRAGHVRRLGRRRRPAPAACPAAADGPDGAPPPGPPCRLHRAARRRPIYGREDA